MVRRVQSSGRTGWYYRVLRPGTARAGDPLRLDSRPYPDWPLRRLNRLLFDRVLSREALEPALQLPLVPSLRRLVESRLQQGDVEDWGRRIDGPARGCSPCRPSARRGAVTVDGRRGG